MRVLLAHAVNGIAAISAIVAILYGGSVVATLGIATGMHLAGLR